MRNHRSYQFGVFVSAASFILTICPLFSAESQHYTSQNQNVALPLLPAPVLIQDGVIQVPTQYSSRPTLIQTAAPQFEIPKKVNLSGNLSGEELQPPALTKVPAPTHFAAVNQAVNPVAASVTRTYHLRRASADVLAKRLTEKLSGRFVHVKSQENNANLSRFELPLQNGTNVELILDRQNSIVTVNGSADKMDAVIQLVQLLENAETNAVNTTEFMPVQKPNYIAVKHVAEVVNEQTQGGGGANRQLPQAVNPNENNTSGSVLGPVQIDIIDGLDTMVIKGSPRDVKAIQEMLKQLETMSLEHEPVIELVPMKHADSYRISRFVQQLYSQVYVARRGNITMLPLIKPNTILIIGKDESIKAAKELIAKLDTPVAPDAGFQIFRLKHASSDTLAGQITSTLQATPGFGQGLETQVSVISDFRTNALIVQANPRDLVTIAALIAQLDTGGSEITNPMKTFSLKNAVASELATTLQNAFNGTSSGGGGFAGFFGNAGSSSNTTQRGAMVTLGSVDKDGNVVRSSLLFDVKVAADTRSNTLIVTAPQETMPLIEALIAQLDQLPSAESQIKVFTLANGDAYTLTTTLTNLFASGSTGGGTGGFGGGTASQSNQMATVRPGIEANESTLVSVRFQTDTRTNSIIACGTAGDMAVVEALLIRLDAENANNRKVMLLKLVNIPAEDIAPILQTYVQNERQLEIQNSTTLLPQSPLEQYRKELNVVAEPISNSLIISTTPRYYEQIKKIVRTLDERPLMVAIQCLIAEVRIDNNKERGVELGLQDSLLFDRSLPAATGGSLLPGFLFGQSSQGLPLGNVNAGTVGSQGITSLGTTRDGGTGIGGFTFSASSESVSILVRALETQQKIRVLTKPQLTTMHNKRASILVGQDVPFASQSSTSNNTTSTSTEWKKVGTILDITPRIMPDGMIALALYVEQSSMGRQADGTTLFVSEGQEVKQAAINNTNAQTTISAMDGQTIVFAGLITEQKETVNRSIPGLNKIPVLKHLFEFDQQLCQRKELLIVMTPTIIRNHEDMERFRQQETSRMHWCISDVVKLTGNSNMRLRSDEWYPNEIPMRPGEAIELNESQLPAENKIPLPILAPTVD